MADIISTEGICVRAAAWTIKYCEKDGYNKPLLINVPLLETCVHKGNRGFVYTQGKGCRTLLGKLGQDGFLIDVANSNGIVMRELPVADRPANYETFLEYNMKKSSNDELLAGAYLASDPVGFANLAHCHVEQIGRAIIRKLKWGHDVFPPELGLKACDPNGNLSISALAAHPNLKELQAWLEVGFQGFQLETGAGSFRLQSRI